MKGLCFFILFLAYALPVRALELKRETIDSNGSKRPIITFQFKNKKVSLPHCGFAIETFHNKKKTLWAINVHEVSNINDVDLVLCEGNNIFTALDIGNKIEPFLIKKSIVPDLPWEENYLRVKSIHDSILNCSWTLIAPDRKTKIICQLKVQVLVRNGSIFYPWISVRK